MSQPTVTSQSWGTLGPPPPVQHVPPPPTFEVVTQLDASSDGSGATDTANIQNALLNLSPGQAVGLVAETFFLNGPLLVPIGTTLVGAGYVTQSGDATGMDWMTVLKPVAGWTNTYQGQALPTYTGTAATDSTMNGTAASGFTGTYTIQDVPYMLDGYPAAGTVQVQTSTGQTATITYTGITRTITLSGGVVTVTNNFTGCSVAGAPTGNFKTGNIVTSSAMAYGQGGVVYMIDMNSLGAANPKVPRCGVTGIWIDGSQAPAGVDGIMSWGQVTATTMTGIGFNAVTGNAIGGYQNSAFGVGLAVGSNQPDGWNLRDIIAEKGDNHGVFGYLQDSTLINVHPQQNGQGGVSGDGFVIYWSHNLMTHCRSDLNYNGFTIMDQGGMGNSQYWAVTELNGCTTQRNKQRGLQRFNTGADGQTQQSPTKILNCAFEGDGTAGTYGAMFIAGRNVVDLSGTSVHCYEIDTNTGCPAYALEVGGQGSGPGYPGVIHWKGGFANAATALLNPANGSAYLQDIDITSYGAGAYFNESSTPPYTYRSHQTASVTTTYQVRPQDEMVFCNANSGAFTATLPASAGLAQTGTSPHTAPTTPGYDPVPVGKAIVFVKTDSSAHPVTIATTSPDRVNGLTSVQLQSQWQRCEITWNGSAWNVTGGSVAAAAAYYTPADPAATSSTSLVALGLGATLQYTPVSTGEVRGTLTGYGQTATAAAQITAKLVYGPVAGPATTIAAGSNGGVIANVASWSSPSAGVLDVASTAGYATSGTVWVANSTGVAQIAYTGIATGQLTGCTFVQQSGANTGTVSTGSSVTGWPQNGAPGASVGTQIGVQVNVKGGAATSPAAVSFPLGTHGGSGPLVLPAGLNWFELLVSTGSGADAAEVIQNMMWVEEVA